MKFGMGDRHMGLHGLRNFTSIGAQGWVCGPKKFKNG